MGKVYGVIIRWIHNKNDIIVKSLLKIAIIILLLSIIINSISYCLGGMPILVAPLIISEGILIVLMFLFLAMDI